MARTERKAEAEREKQKIRQEVGPENYDYFVTTYGEEASLDTFRRQLAAQRKGRRRQKIKFGKDVLYYLARPFGKSPEPMSAGYSELVGGVALGLIGVAGVGLAVVAFGPGMLIIPPAAFLAYHVGRSVKRAAAYPRR